MSQKIMTADHWQMLEAIGNFSRREVNAKNELCFPLPYNMDFMFMVKQQLFRKTVGKPVAMHCTFETVGHASRSEHGKIPCAAGDGHVAHMALIDEVKILVKIFDRVGIYPYTWYSRGWHVDDGVRLGRHKQKLYWIEDERKTGDYKYFTDVEEFINAVKQIPACMEVF